MDDLDNIFGFSDEDDIDTDEAISASQMFENEKEKKMEITPEIKAQVLEHSTTRRIAKEFPEYQQFFTGEVDQIRSRIENVIGDQSIEVLEEKMSGNLGDMIDVYFDLKQELKFKKSFWGRCWYAFAFSFKRQTYDIEYLLSNLKRALNHLRANWY